MATTQYTIYLVNNSATTQVFWCFLAPPEELASDPNVYANSNTSLAVASQAPGINTFTIPVQYVVGAGASNNAVGQNIIVTSNITNNAELTDTWQVNYATVPPNMGPSMKKQSAKAPANKIAIQSNEFDPATNEASGWFSNMSFGIKTQQGFMGMTWSPSPQQTRTLTPKLKFYVATGEFGQNELADWTTISKNSAEISVPNDFQYNKVTVTLTGTGGWEVTQGAPPSLLAFRTSNSGLIANLINSQQLLSAAHKELVDVVKGYSEADIQLGGNPPEKTQTVKLVSVKWDQSVTDEKIGNTYLTGTITVSTALIASFSVFVLAGVDFSVTNNNPQGRTTFSFSYSGTRTIQQIRDMFVAGVPLFFQNPRSLDISDNYSDQQSAFSGQLIG